MVLAFLFSWVPFGWMYLLPLLGIQQRGHRQTTDVLPLFAVKLGCAIINPLVYSFTNLQVLLYYYNYTLIFQIYNTFTAEKLSIQNFISQFHGNQGDHESDVSINNDNTFFKSKTIDKRHSVQKSLPCVDFVQQNLIKTENEINVSLEHNATQHAFATMHLVFFVLSNFLLVGMEH